MRRFWKTPEFESLQREWDERLKASGFVDAERQSKSERFLKDAASEMFRTKSKRPERTQLFVESNYQYFQALAEFSANEKEYDDEYDRLIMERTSAGCSISEISAELRRLIPPGRKRTKFNRNTITHVRRRYETRWGIRVWAPEQMVPRKVRTK